MIYLDNLATTPVDRRVVDSMLPWFTEHFGNPSSRSHAYGWTAADAVEEARGAVAALIGARRPREILFTSGATEANNLALKGMALHQAQRGRHLVSTAIEHKAVLDCCSYLERQGCRVTRVPVSQDGVVDPEQVAAALEDDTFLVSVMLANNEVGTVQPLGRIVEVAHEHGVPVHTDAAQAVGKVPVDVAALDVDLLTLSAHKLYGPKGVGALYLRTRQPPLRLEPQLHGGGQERGLRGGTLNVPGIVGLGVACRLCHQEMTVEAKRIAALRDRLLARLQEGLPELQRNGSAANCVPGCLNVSLPGVDGSRLLTAFRDLALAAGSACTSGTQAPSHVLAALGVPPALAQATLRLGVGRQNTAAEIDLAAARIIEEATALRLPPGP